MSNFLPFRSEGYQGDITDSIPFFPHAPLSQNIYCRAFSNPLSSLPLLMPFGFGRSSTPVVGVSRSQHISGFLSHHTFSRGTKKIPTDGSTDLYETSFAPAASASPYTLQVYLSPSFPGKPPIITLIRPTLATHPILNENMQCCVSLNSLKGWPSNGRTLVQVVEEVAQSLIQRAPNVVGAGSASPAKPPSYDEARRSSRSGSSSSGEAKSGGEGSCLPQSEKLLCF